MSHPDDSTYIEFDDANESHLLAHQVTAVEVWEVFENEPLWARNKKGMAATWLMIGRTWGGRPLVIAVVHNEDESYIRPVTGRTCEPHEVAKWSV